MANVILSSGEGICSKVVVVDQEAPLRVEACARPFEAFVLRFHLIWPGRWIVFQGGSRIEFCSVVAQLHVWD
jgi:hypothetical protein